MPHFMTYVTAKELRVETNWNKRGLAGLRSNLLSVVAQHRGGNIDTTMFINAICVLVWGTLPRREWDIGERVIRETLGLLNIDSEDFVSEITVAKMNEEELRDELGDE